MATSLSSISVFLLYMWKMGGFEKGERLGVEPIQRTVKKLGLLYIIMFYGKRSLAVQCPDRA
jgi:hypothetical protein